MSVGDSFLNTAANSRRELSLLVQWEIFRREKIGPRLSRKEREGETQRQSSKVCRKQEVGGGRGRSPRWEDGSKRREKVGKQVGWVPGAGGGGGGGGGEKVNCGLRRRSNICWISR